MFFFSFPFFWWPFTWGLTCGQGGERQAQHLRVMGLNLHQLVQKIQTKNTEHTHANASVGVITVHHSISVRCTFCPNVVFLTAGFHSDLRLPGVVHQDWFPALWSQPSHRLLPTPPSPPPPAGAACSPLRTKSSAGPERHAGSDLGWQNKEK